MILLAGCRGGTSPEALSPDSSNSAFKFPELHDALAAEFTRLGIDPDKVPAKVASGDANAVFDLTLTVDDPDGEGPTPASGVTLKWTERMLGDYDQNGLVNASDITPLGQNFQQSVIYDDPFSHNGLEYWPTGNPDDGGSGSANWRRARVDGNDDGLVGLSDITSIAQHWNEQLSGYVVQMAVNRGDGELNWTDVDSGNGIAPSIARPSVNNAAPVRYELYIPLGEAQFAHHFRVLPFDAGTDERGALSNRADFYPVDQGDTTPPYWLDTVGVQQLVPSSEQIRVEFGNAEDSQSPPVSYRVYWEETTEGSLDPFDYGSAQSEDVTESPFTITGLTNEQYYRVAVRAVDSAEPPNEEQNLKVLGALVEPRDVYPPEWNEAPGIQELYYGDGSALVVIHSATDHHEDGYGVWESEPVSYRVYFGEGTVPDWQTAQVQEFVDIGLDTALIPIEGLDTTVTRWFAVRAIDSAEIANEDQNTEVKIGYGVTVTEIEIPAEGPSIEDPEVAKPVGFTFTPDRQKHRFLVRSEKDDWHWISSYELVGSEYEFKDDLRIAEISTNPLYSVKASCLTADVDLKFVYISSSELNGPIQFAEFQQEVESSITYFENGPTSIEAIGYDLNANAFIILNDYNADDIFNVKNKYYFSRLPIERNNLIYDTEDEFNEYSFRFAYDTYALLSNGKIGLFANKTDLSAFDTYLYLQVDNDSNSTVELISHSYPATYDVTGYNVDNPIIIEEYNKPDDTEEIIVTSNSNGFVLGTILGASSYNVGKPKMINTEHYVYQFSFTTKGLYTSPGIDENFMIAVMVQNGTETKYLLNEAHSSDFRTDAIFEDYEFINSYFTKKSLPGIQRRVQLLMEVNRGVM
ncbi:MAG: fibronectin type III domain-containing protein [bacterium]